MNIEAEKGQKTKQKIIKLLNWDNTFFEEQDCESEIKDKVKA